MNSSIQTTQDTLGILIVDDRESDREYYKNCLELEPLFKYHIKESKCVKEALDLCKNQKFDCVLLDYRLPDKTGVDFLNEASFLQETAVIMLTGLGDEAIAVAAMQNGADNYLNKKDVNSVSLQNAIRKAYEHISLKKQIEDHKEELIKSNQDLESFAYIASHDLKEPLRQVINAGDRLESKYSDKLDPKAKKYIEIMTSSSQRMRRLLEALLKYSKTSSQQLEFTKVSLKESLENVAKDLDSKIKENNAQVQIIGELPVIEAEPALIEDLFLNLINNSIKFQEPGNSPLIKITIKDHNGILKIELEDNGIGFPDDQAEKIFGQFYRVHGKADYEGSGMGLSICKRIVEKHNGFIDARSLKTSGSLFTITLPIKQLKA